MHFFNYVMRKVWMHQTRIGLSLYDVAGLGYLRESVHFVQFCFIIADHHRIFTFMPAVLMLIKQALFLSVVCLSVKLAFLHNVAALYKFVYMLVLLLTCVVFMVTFPYVFSCKAIIVYCVCLSFSVSTLYLLCNADCLMSLQV